jgi:predicted lysophospholipase L1 biosynthesis ABC-type transport system permease subunit
MELVPDPLINTPEALDAATAAAIQARRDKLLRIAKGKGIRVRLAYGCAAIVAMCAIAAFVAGDRKAAIILAGQFCLVVGFVFLATSAARRKALGQLQEMKQSA